MCSGKHGCIDHLTFFRPLNVLTSYRSILIGIRKEKTNNFIYSSSFSAWLPFAKSETLKDNWTIQFKLIKTFDDGRDFVFRDNIVCARSTRVHTLLGTVF